VRLTVACHLDCQNSTNSFEFRNNIVVEVPESLVELTVFILKADVCIHLINNRLFKLKVCEHARDENDGA